MRRRGACGECVWEVCTTALLILFKFTIEETPHPPALLHSDPSSGLGMAITCLGSAGSETQQVQGSALGKAITRFSSADSATQQALIGLRIHTRATLGQFS